MGNFPIPSMLHQRTDFLHYQHLMQQIKTVDLHNERALRELRRQIDFLGGNVHSLLLNLLVQKTGNNDASNGIVNC